MPTTAKKSSKTGMKPAAKAPAKAKKPASAEKPVPVSAPEYRVEMADIGRLVADPKNARVHPERNRAALRASLAKFGQAKPLVVRPLKGGKLLVLAGNNLLAEARVLGWEKLAVHILDVDAATGTAYALADNKVAELAEWDYEIVADQLRALRQAATPSVEGVLSAENERMADLLAATGFADFEIEPLLQADFNPEPPNPDAGSGDGSSSNGGRTLHFNEEQWAKLSKVLARFRGESAADAKLSDADLVTAILSRGAEA